MAPEFFVKDKKLKDIAYSNKIDIWAIGVTAYFMLSGCLPFDGKGNDVKL